MKIMFYIRQLYVRYIMNNRAYFTWFDILSSEKKKIILLILLRS